MFTRNGLSRMEHANACPGLAASEEIADVERVQRMRGHP